MSPPPGSRPSRRSCPERTKKALLPRGQKGFVGDGTSRGVPAARACDNEPIQRLNSADSTPRAVAAGAALRDRIAVERRIIVGGLRHGLPVSRRLRLRSRGRRRGRDSRRGRSRRRSGLSCRGGSRGRRGRAARRTGGSVSIAVAIPIPAPAACHAVAKTGRARRPRRTAHHRPSPAAAGAAAMAKQPRRRGQGREKYQLMH